MRSVPLLYALALLGVAMAYAQQVAGTSEAFRVLVWNPLFTLVIPYVLARDAPRVRVIRIGLVIISSIIGEFFCIAIYHALTHATTFINATDADTTSILETYLFALPLVALILECIVALSPRDSAEEDARLSLPVIAHLLETTVILIVLVLRLNKTTDAGSFAPLLSVALSLASIAYSHLLVMLSRMDIHQQRSATYRAAQARLYKHSRTEVARITQSAAAINRLRHDLANQVGIVEELVDEGRLADADRYLSRLQQQASQLSGYDHA